MTATISSEPTVGAAASASEGAAIDLIVAEANIDLAASSMNSPNFPMQANSNQSGPGSVIASTSAMHRT